MNDSYSYLFLFNVCIILFILLFYLHNLNLLKFDILSTFNQLAYNNY